VLKEDGTTAAGTVHKASKDYLVRMDADGTEVGVALDKVRVLGLGAALEVPASQPNDNVWFHYSGGHYRFGLRGAPCPAGFTVTVAPETQQCLAKSQVAPDRWLTAVTLGARVLKMPLYGDKDAVAGTVVASSGDGAKVRFDDGKTSDVKLKKLRLLAGKGTLGEPVPQEAKRCAKLNVRNKAFSSRGSVGFKFKNRCLRPVKCRMKIEYYCAHDEGDTKTTWFHCDRAAAPGESMTCADKRCRKPRKGDEAVYKLLECDFGKK